MSKYSEEQIELTQEIIEELINVLKNGENFLEKLTDFDITSSFNNFINGVFAVIFLNINGQDKLLKSIGNTQFSQGIVTLIIFYSTLFFISKGLEKSGFKIEKKLYEILPYSKQEDVEINQAILGVSKTQKFMKKNFYYELNTNISLVKKSFLKLGGDGTRKVGCPYTQNKIGKDLNKVLSESMLELLNLLYAEILNYQENQYVDAHPQDTPDHINVLLGRFEISISHIKNYPQYFTEMNWIS